MKDDQGYRRERNERQGYRREERGQEGYGRERSFDRHQREDKVRPGRSSRSEERGQPQRSESYPWRQSQQQTQEQNKPQRQRPKRQEEQVITPDILAKQQRLLDVLKAERQQIQGAKAVETSAKLKVKSKVLKTKSAKSTKKPKRK